MNDSNVRERCGRGDSIPRWWIRIAICLPANAISNSTRFVRGWWPAQGDYRWASYRANAQGSPNALLEPHPAFELIAWDQDERRRRYAEFIEEGIPAADLAAIRRALQSQRRLLGMLMGSEPFRDAKGI